MKLLIVTPSLGRSPYAGDLLRSLRDIPGSFEHIVVGPQDKLRTFEESQMSRVVGERKASGMYAAINEGIHAARSEWTHFTYINDDDVLLVDKKKTWDRLCAAALRADVVFGRVGVVAADGQELFEFPVCRIPSVLPILWKWRKMPYTQQGTFIARSAFAKVGLFDAGLKYAGDAEMLMRLHRAGLRHSFVNERVASFRINRGQLSGDRVAFERELRMVRERHGYNPNPWLRRLLGTLFLIAMNPGSYWRRFNVTGFRRTASYVCLGENGERKRGS